MDKIKYFLFLFFIIVYLFPGRVFSQEVVLEFDFQEVTQGDVLSHTFFINYDIKGIVSECECFSAQVLSAPGEIPAKIKVTFDSTGYISQVNQRIILIDKDDNIFAIAIKANVKQ